MNEFLTLCSVQIFDLKCLAVLKVDDNKLTELNKNVGKLARTLTWLGIERNMITWIPGEFSALEVLEMFNVTVLTLEPDIQWALEMGLDVLRAYVRLWSMVKHSHKINLNWSSSSDWEPLPKVSWAVPRNS